MPPIRFNRRPTPEELDFLLPPGEEVQGWGTSVFGAITFSIGVFFAAFVLVSFFDAAPIWGVPLAVASGVIAGIGLFAVWLKRERRAAKLRAAQRAAEAAGELEVTRFKVLDAIAVKESQDEGPHFYLLLDDGRTLFLSGEYLYEAVAHEFPWNAFEMVRVPGEYWVLAMTRLGDPLRPTWQRAPLTLDELQQEEDGSIEVRDWAGLKR